MKCAFNVPVTKFGDKKEKQRTGENERIHAKPHLDLTFKLCAPTSQVSVVSKTGLVYKPQSIAQNYSAAELQETNEKVRNK